MKKDQFGFLMNNKKSDDQGAFDSETKFYNFESLKNALQRVYKSKLVEKGSGTEGNNARLLPTLCY